MGFGSIVGSDYYYMVFGSTAGSDYHGDHNAPPQYRTRRCLPHYHTITLSHYHTITPSHYHTITLSHYHTITLPQYHTPLGRFFHGRYLHIFGIVSAPKKSVWETHRRGLCEDVLFGIGTLFDSRAIELGKSPQGGMIYTVVCRR